MQTDNTPLSKHTTTRHVRTVMPPSEKGRTVGFTYYMRIMKVVNLKVVPSALCSICCSTSSQYHGNAGNVSAHTACMTACSPSRLPVLTCRAASADRLFLHDCTTAPAKTHLIALQLVDARFLLGMCHRYRCTDCNSQWLSLARSVNTAT